MGLLSAAKEGHTADYHKVFNRQNFVAWWCNQLLPKLKVPSLIILDSAKYHLLLVRPEGTSNPSRIKKQECTEYYLESVGELVDAKQSVLKLKVWVKGWVAANVPTKIKQLLEATGQPQNNVQATI